MSLGHWLARPLKKSISASPLKKSILIHPRNIISDYDTIQYAMTECDIFFLNVWTLNLEPISFLFEPKIWDNIVTMQLWILNHTQHDSLGNGFDLIPCFIL